MNFKNPKTLDLINRKKKLSISNVDSNEDNKMISFLLSHINGLNRHVKITTGLLRSMPPKVEVRFDISKPALLVSSCIWVFW